MNKTVHTSDLDESGAGPVAVRILGKQGFDEKNGHTKNANRPDKIETLVFANSLVRSVSRDGSTTDDSEFPLGGERVGENCV
jgi:hypothetical protein